MNITEVEKTVGLAKANIKYYQGEGLLAPGKNPENGKIDFSPEDIAALQKIKILRVAGVPLKKVKSLMLSNKSMVETLNETEKVLNDQIVILEEKKTLCVTMRSRGELFHEIDLASYDLEAQLPHTNLREINTTDKVFRAKFIDLLAVILGLIVALVLIAIPTYLFLAESIQAFPWWAISGCAVIEIICILILITGSKKKKKIPKK
jgi:DNA-binding transcriptional MerR regulator